MSEQWERQLRATLAEEQFGVLATIARGRLHTATVHFAETDDLDILFAIRPASLKARLAALNPHATFQVDTRATAIRAPESFTRISLEGFLAPVEPDAARHDEFRRVFTGKLPVGAYLLEQPEVALYLLRSERIRIAVGAEQARDFTLSPAPAG